MIANKKTSLLIATSAFALAIGFAAKPASATFVPPNFSDCCGVNWDFVDSGIDLNIEPDYFQVSAVSSICADQLFVGEMDVKAIVAKADVEYDLDNVATAAANVISASGGTYQGETVASSFPIAVTAVQSLYGDLGATAEVNGGSFWWPSHLDVGGELTNTATAAGNMISINTTELALLDADQIAGSWRHKADVKAEAIVSHANVAYDLSNSATGALNVISVNVTPGALQVPPVETFKHPKDPKENGNGNNHLDLVSLALVDVSQTAFADMDVTAKVYKVDVAGSLTNSATAAANVINVVNTAPVVR